MKRKPILVAGIMLSIALIYISCVHEVPVPSDPGGNASGSVPGGGLPCSSDSVYFVNDILPMLVSGCAMSGCHDAASHKDGVILTSYAGIMKEVKAGNATNSSLYKVIVRTDGERMPPPPAPPMTAQQVAAIKTWINQGAKNNSCDRCDTTSFTFSKAIRPLMQNKCQGCHNPNSPGGGIDLSTYAGIKASALNGTLYGSVTWATGFTKMPQGGSKLPDCEIRQIKKWIDAGTPND